MPNIELMANLDTLLTYGGPPLGLVIITIIAVKLFKRAKYMRTSHLFTIAFALCITVLAYVSVMVRTWIPVIKGYIAELLNTGLMVRLYGLLIFGGPPLGLVIITIIAVKLFKRAKCKRSRHLFTIAFALCIAVLASAVTMTYFWLDVKGHTGMGGLFYVLSIPVYGVYVVLGAFPLAWAMITQYFVVLKSLGVLSETGDSYGKCRKFISVLILLIYIAIGIAVLCVQKLT